MAYGFVGLGVVALIMGILLFVPIPNEDTTPPKKAPFKGVAQGSKQSMPAVPYDKNAGAGTRTLANAANMWSPNSGEAASFEVSGPVQ